MGQEGGWAGGAKLCWVSWPNTDSDSAVAPKLLQNWIAPLPQTTLHLTKVSGYLGHIESKYDLYPKHGPKAALYSGHPDIFLQLRELILTVERTILQPNPKLSEPRGGVAPSHQNGNCLIWDYSSLYWLFWFENQKHYESPCWKSQRVVDPHVGPSGPIYRVQDATKQSTIFVHEIMHAFHLVRPSFP